MIENLLEPKWVPKSWGGEQWFVNNEYYCSKLLYVKKDRYCSFHFHKLKTETFVVVQGKILLRYSYDDIYEESESIELSEGQVFHVPIGMRHRFTALDNDALILEISTHHEDSDSIRVLPSYEE